MAWYSSTPSSVGTAAAGAAAKLPAPAGAVPVAAPAPRPVSAPAPAGGSGPGYALSQDPAYLAFLRSSGLTQDLALGDAARQRDNVNQALGLSLEDLDASGERGRRDISGSQESRGVFRSGQTLQRMSEQEEDQARRRGAINLAGSGQLGDIEYNLANLIAGQQGKSAEAGLSYAGNQSLSNGLTALSNDPTLRRRY